MTGDPEPTKSRTVRSAHNSTKKTLADCGEDAVLAALLAELPPIQDASVVTGVGDDCATLRPVAAGRLQLLKTDCVIEGVHFTPDTAPQKIGWKAMCRPLSDIAAMGGEPCHALVTLALSAGVSLRWARGVYAGIGRAAREFGVSVVGGETARSPGPCFLSICLTGTVAAKNCVTRSGGRVGDRVYVTGRLGGSFKSGRHLRFRPRLAEARWLVERYRIHAMMDLSDGLATDLPRMAAASGTGFRLEPAKIPRSAGCTLAQALGDGEDYELLFALGARAGATLEKAWRSRFPRLRLAAIGSLTDPGVAEGLENITGYVHFRQT